MNAELLTKYGPLIGGSDLYKALGFKTYSSFKLAKARSQIPIHIFQIPERKGWFALTLDLSDWLVGLTNRSGINSMETGE